jgi:hypothetical protein
MIVRKIRKVVALRGTLPLVGLILPLFIMSLTDVTAAAEKIPDWELTELYGGHVLYYNPYCVLNGSCPTETLCEVELGGCRFCVPLLGYYCHDGWSENRDTNGCTDGSQGCPNANLWPNPSTGFCGPSPGYVCNPDWSNWGPYPDCSDSVPTCKD